MLFVPVISVVPEIAVIPVTPFIPEIAGAPLIPVIPVVPLSPGMPAVPGPARSGDKPVLLDQLDNLVFGKQKFQQFFPFPAHVSYSLPAIVQDRTTHYFPA
jgi:hypothetical protein